MAQCLASGTPGGPRFPLFSSHGKVKSPITMSCTSDRSSLGSDQGQHQPAVSRAELGSALFFALTQARTS